MYYNLLKNEQGSIDGAVRSKAADSRGFASRGRARASAARPRSLSSKRQEPLGDLSRSVMSVQAQYGSRSFGSKNKGADNYDALYGPKIPQRQGEFQSLFELAASRFGIDRQFHSIRVCNEARKFLGSRLQGQSGKYQVVSFRNGILTVSADSPALLQIIQLQAHLLQAELNKTNRNSVRKIHLKSA